MDNNKFQQEKIKVYLSYRFDYKEERRSLQEQCKNKNIDLAFDEKEIKEGESITQFMDQLADARFILVLLTGDYFESAYTLHELLLIFSRVKENKERLNPEFVRLRNDISMKSITEIENYWDENKELRNELTRLQGKNEDEVLYDLKKVWENLIRPFLELKQDSSHLYDWEDDVLDRIIGNAEAIFNEEQNSLKSRVKREIKKLVDDFEFPIRELYPYFDKKQIRQEEFVDFLTSLPTSEAIAGFQDWVSKFSIKDRHRQKRGEHLDTVLDICSWLLLLSVDPYWWMHNRFLINRKIDQSMFQELCIKDRKYAEVIYSRNYLVMPEFDIDTETKELKLGGKDYDPLVFDGSDEAQSSELLSGIYIDMITKDAKQDIPEDDDLLMAVIDEIEARTKVKNVIIYYVIDQKLLNNIQKESWYSTMQKKLKGKFHFLIATGENQEHPICNERVGPLLRQIRNVASAKLNE